MVVLCHVLLIHTMYSMRSRDHKDVLKEKHAEIAAILEKPDGTVRKLLARTLHKLRAGYEQQEKGGRL
jgi:Sigma-70, region 4